MSNNLKTLFLCFSVLFLFVFFAFNSVLSAYYIWHDDWALFLLEKNNLIDTIKAHRYRSAHTEMGRPLGHAFFSIGPYFVEKFSDANIVRLFTLILISFFGTLLFKLFSTLNYNKIFSVLFTGIFLITPPFYIISYQIAGQYIVFSLIISVIFMMLCKNYYYDKNSFLVSRGGSISFILFLLFLLYFGAIVNTRFFIIGLLYYLIIFVTLYLLRKNRFLEGKKLIYYFAFSLLLFFALCIYAHATLIVIALPILILFSNIKNNDIKYKVIYEYLLLTVITIFLYFITLKSFIVYENINTLIEGRRIQIDFNIIDKIKFYFSNVFPHAFSLWRIDMSLKFLSYSILFFSLLGSFFYFYRKNSFLESFYNIFIIFLTLFLTIGPVIFVKDNFFTPYRSMIGHTFILYFLPLILMFLLFSKVNYGRSLFFIIIPFFIYTNGHWPNTIINDYVIKPTEIELQFISKELEKYNVAQRIKKNERLKIYLNKLNKPSMHDNLIQNMVIAAATGNNIPWVPEIIHSLLYDRYGLKYSLQRRDINEKISYIDKNNTRIQIISVDFPWGNLIFSSNLREIVDVNDLNSNIFIDMNKIEFNQK